jgi:DNA-binding HxlR family transcriptional regulator
MLTRRTSFATLKEMDKRLTLHVHGKHLWTRELAKQIRTTVQQNLDALKAGDVLVLDLSGVEVFDYSFANELFGKTLLSLSSEFPGRFIVVENLTDYTRENLSKALESLGLAIIVRKKLKLELLGKAHPSDVETFGALVAANEPISAVELSKRLSVNLTAMNERLTKLGAMGLVRREKSASVAGREQYTYRVLG